MSKIGIFFGPTNGSVHRAAEKIKAAFAEHEIQLIPINTADIDNLEEYKLMIFGISTLGQETWTTKYPTSDWDKFMPCISKTNFSGKTVAIFGLGDHVRYPSHFVDAMGTLAKELMKNGATIVGQTDPSGYNFVNSEAIFDGKFIGLPIDETFESELTDERIANWTESIKPAFTT